MTPPDAAGALIVTSGRVNGIIELGSGTRRLRGWLLCELLVERSLDLQLRLSGCGSFVLAAKSSPREHAHVRWMHVVAPLPPLLRKGSYY